MAGNGRGSRQTMPDIEDSFAPMEGITYVQYRMLHCRIFGGVNKYYTPFIAPDSNGSFKHKYLSELTTDKNSSLVPQLLVNNIDAFNKTALKLYDLGFTEINLNAGCPSGTVFAKHKGAGMLADLQSLSEILEGIFNQAERKGYQVSIKTRMGIKSTDELSMLLDVFQAYPVAELIVHARCREDYYEGAADMEAFISAAKQCSIPLTYNGDIRTAEDVETLLAKAPGCSSIMIGRAAVANPALFRVLQGGPELEREELKAFHDELVEIWLETGLSPAFTVMRMKTLWTYMKELFPESQKQMKAILKAKTMNE